MDSSAQFRVDIGVYIGSIYWPLLKSTYGVHVFWLTRDIDRSSYRKKANPFDRKVAFMCLIQEGPMYYCSWGILNGMVEKGWGHGSGLFGPMVSFFARNPTDCTRGGVPHM